MFDKSTCDKLVEDFYNLPNGDCETAEGRAAVLAKMRLTTEVFYQLAVWTNCHPFIEFCGVMNEYIKICEDLDTQNINFADINVHSGQKANIPDYRLAYIREKLECIFSGFETQQVFHTVTSHD